MRQSLEAVDAREIWDEEDDTCHLNGTARMGPDRRSSVVDADCRSWHIPNLWICDGSVFPTVGGVNRSLSSRPSPAGQPTVSRPGGAW